MLFNSVEFLIFLPVVFLLYWFVFKSVKGQNGLVVLASYVFYGWWDYRFLGLIIAITLVSYLAGIYLDKQERPRGRRLAVMWGGVAFACGILFIFKYFDFFARSFARILGAAGFAADAVTLDLILPVGLSFYVFQSIGYIVDVYKRRIVGTHDVLAFFAFISFFPQLVAGPIERASNTLPQFERPRGAFDYAAGVSGMKLILWGLFKKMVVADNAAYLVDTVFGRYTEAGTVGLWTAAVLFTVQIYCDFSGYSDIAVGAARLFGINLMQNFRYPFFAHNIKEFWHRWHISLTTWFRDYIYIPLGGGRKGVAATIRNSTIVFLVSGLWHGAALTFVLWGAYHAVVYLPACVNRGRNLQHPAGVLYDVWAMGTTFMLVVLGFVIFRAESASIAVDYLRLMFGHFSEGGLELDRPAVFWAAVLLVVEWFSRHKETPFDFSDTGLWRYRAVRWGICLLTFVVTLIFAGNSQEFIYFRF